MNNDGQMMPKAIEKQNECGALNNLKIIGFMSKIIGFLK